MAAAPLLLAFDTSNEAMALALVHGERQHVLDAEGGAMASAHLIDELLRLVTDAGLRMADITAIAFGHGPGAFTGLRTACSVAQGLALGLDKPVLALDSLCLVAEAARARHPEQVEWAVAMDARMDEIYGAQYRWDGKRWHTLQAPALLTLPAVQAQWQAQPPRAVTGSALLAFGDRLVLPADALREDAPPGRAAALARLVRLAWRDDVALDATQALPLYLRNKVALTTDERAALKAAKATA